MEKAEDEREEKSEVPFWVCVPQKGLMSIEAVTWKYRD